MGSIDSISFVCNVPRPPPLDFLTEQDWRKKRAKFPGTFKWINNRMIDVHEPQLTFYQTWQRHWRLRVDLSIPNLVNGNNIHLLDDEQLAESFETVSNNVTLRSGSKFNALEAGICRIHYALNFLPKGIPVSTILTNYARYNVPRMRRVAYGDETVYFQNESRVLKIYEKSAEVGAKHGKNSPLVKEAKDLLRIEYSLPNATAVKRFANRHNFADVTAATMCSRECIDIAINEMSELLRLDSIGAADQQLRIKTLFNLTQDMKAAERCEGFLKSEEAFGKNHYLDGSLHVSKSTYTRKRRECQKLGF